jgi:hypothetical protein
MSELVLVHEGIELLVDSHQGEERASVRLLYKPSWMGLERRWKSGNSERLNKGCKGKRSYRMLVEESMIGEGSTIPPAHWTTLEPARKV